MDTTFKYLQCLPFLEENTYLLKAINEEIKIIDSGLIANLKYILDLYELSNLMINIFKVIEGDISNIYIYIYTDAIDLASVH